MGRFALALALLMTAVATVSVIPLANIQAQMVVSLGTVDIDTSMLGEAWMASASSPMMTWLGSLFGAVVAIVIGIVAVVSARGRGPGVAAIVVGILSPVAWIACWIAILVPATIAVG
ncbi:MAG: hypothetical protein LWW77_03055 [Propionibacteriales bacterium]|nr:hypothetical protein [Propionibacteriales bacterium]